MISEGDKVQARTLTTISGDAISLPATDELTHLQFRRFAGCPICSLHMHELKSRHSDITRAGVTEVVVFHSTIEALRRYQADLPFAVVADPNRKLYDEFDVQKSLRGVFRPQVVRAVGRGLPKTKSVVASMGLRENHSGMPADFLISADGIVLARKYGVHADDQWSVDELLTFADGVAK